MTKKLSHLSSEQVDELLRRYYETNRPVSSLISDFSIDVTQAGLVATFPPEVHDKIFCVHCPDQNLISPRQSRYPSHRKKRKMFCPRCLHDQSDNCGCVNCRLQMFTHAQQLEAKKQELISRAYPPTAGVPDSIEELTLWDALCILSATRHSLSDDLQTIYPAISQIPKLAPTPELTNEIAQKLRELGTISVSTKSPTTAFRFDDSVSKVESCYPQKIIWDFMPASSDCEKIEFLDRLENFVQNGNWSVDWHAETDHVWNLIALHECLENFRHLLEQRGFQCENFGPKTRATFQRLLVNFSVAQIFNLSWQSVRDTTDYIVREKLPKYRGDNLFIGTLQRKADKFLAEGWEVRCARRSAGCLRTQLSATFFDVFVGLGEEAIRVTPPHIDAELSPTPQSA